MILRIEGKKDEEKDTYLNRLCNRYSTNNDSGFWV